MKEAETSVPPRVALLWGPFHTFVLHTFVLTLLCHGCRGLGSQEVLTGGGFGSSLEGLVLCQEGAGLFPALPNVPETEGSGA